jgi:hypothetical protein
MIIYYIDGEKFNCKIFSEVPWLYISSVNEQIPAIEDLTNGNKFWYNKGWCCHRLTGPAKIWTTGREEFYLNDKAYENVHSWLKDHPNPDLYFHNIGVFTETDKVLWYLKN